MLSDQFLVEVRLDRDRVPDFEAYPFALNAVKHLDSLALHRSVTFVIGENGSGKSTLLEGLAVAWGFNAEGGTQNFHFDTRQSHSPLHDYMQLSRGYKKPSNGYFLRAESFYNVATEIEELDKEPGGGPLLPIRQDRPVPQVRWSGQAILMVDLTAHMQLRGLEKIAQ